MNIVDSLHQDLPVLHATTDVNMYLVVLMYALIFLFSSADKTSLKSAFCCKLLKKLC